MHEEQRQQRDHEQRQPHQRQHAGDRGLLILLLNHGERHAAHAQRALVRLRQAVDRQLRVVNRLGAGVAQPDGGDRDPRAIRVRSGHHVERRSRRLELRGGPNMVERRIDLHLRDRIEVGYLEQGFHQQGRGGDCIGGRQEFPHARVANDADEQAVHLGESIGREHFTTEDERNHDDIGVPEEGLYLLQRLGDATIPREEASFSATGARCVIPAANTSVTIAMTTSVTHGRTVTSQLSQLSALLMAHPLSLRPWGWLAMPERHRLWLLPELGFPLAPRHGAVAGSGTIPRTIIAAVLPALL